MTRALEIANPSFADIPLEQQIELGINDWVAEGKSGNLYVGQTKQQAESIRQQFESDK